MTVKLHLNLVVECIEKSLPFIGAVDEQWNWSGLLIHTSAELADVELSKQKKYKVVLCVSPTFGCISVSCPLLLK